MPRWMMTGMLMLATSVVSVGHAADAPAKPATVAEAAKVLDLSKHPLMAGSEEPKTRRIAELSYDAKGEVKAVYDFHKQALTKLKWQELPGGYSSEQAASGTFSRDGYRVSVSVFSVGQPGKASVSIINHGNIDLSKVPLPPNVKPFYAGPANAMSITETGKEETAAALKKLLIEKGWQPYGVAGDMQTFKQNAVRLNASVVSAPAQMGKTMIDLQSLLMSADLPAPAETELLQYADITTTVSFDTKLSQDDLVAFYQKALASGGWKQTTDKPIKISFRNVLIYRNPAKELLELQMHDFEGKTRGLLKYQTAAEVEEEERRAKEAIAKKNAEKPAPAGKVSLTVPAIATSVEAKKSSVEFKLPNGKVKSVVEAWRKQFAKDGWKEKVAVVDPMAGSIAVDKGDYSLTITYVDTGFLPAEVTVSLSGGELDVVVEKK